jgi:hypothetical protein
MSQTELIKATLDQIKEAQDLNKATTTGLAVATALQGYDLEAPAKNLYPILAPLRKRVSRSRAAKGSNAINWKAITALGASGSPFVAEAARNSNITYTEADKVASYKTWGRDDKVTQEAEWQARGFEDLRARSTMSLMQQVMVEEEDSILGGNTSLALGTTPTPTTATATTGGTIAAATYNVICVALPYMGYRGSTLAAISSFRAVKSAAASQATTGSTSTLSATVTVVNGAVAYAWFVGTAGNEKMEAITTINSVLFTSLAGTGQAASAVTGTDASTDSLAYDGALYQLFTPASGAYIKVLANGTAGTGTPLTYDSAGGIVEIDAMLKSIWDNARVSPEVLLLNSQEALNLDKKIMAAGSQPIFNIVVAQGNDQQGLTAGVKVVRYINKFTNGTVELMVHPTNPPGTIPALTFNLPEWYNNPNIDSVWDLHMLQDYTELVFAMTTRQWEHGVYCRGVLRGFVPAANGIITNIGNG